MRGNNIQSGIILLLSIFLFSCKQSPENVVEKYLDHTFLNNNGKKAYKLLSADDKLYVSENEFINDIKKENILSNKVIKKYGDKFFYKLTDSRIHGDTIFVKVMLTRPNAEYILNEMVDYAMLTAFSKKNEKDKNSSVSKKFNQLLLSNNLETVTEEKEFVVLKEKNKYKIYLNLGLPYKMAKIREEVKKLKAIAWEEEKLINYNNVYDLYKKINNYEATPEARDKLSELEKMKANTLALGETKTFGNLEFTPEKIEKRRVRIAKMNWHEGIPHKEYTREEYFVLTFTAKNISKNQVFAYEDENKYKAENILKDNLGNTLIEFGPTYDIFSVEDNVYKKFNPGESRKIKVVCEASVEGANHFLWQISLYTDNQKTEEKVYIKFGREQIMDNLKLATK